MNLKDRIKNIEMKVSVKDTTLAQMLVLVLVVPVSLWWWAAGVLLAVGAALLDIKYVDYTLSEYPEWEENARKEQR